MEELGEWLGSRLAPFSAGRLLFGQNWAAPGVKAGTHIIHGRRQREIGS